MRALAQSRLYGILDLQYVAASEMAPMAKRLLAGGVDLLQLRAKNLSSEEVEELARELIGAIGPAGVPLIINDHPAVARAVGAAGVHLGQDDLSVSAARALMGEGIIGKSTHSFEQAVAAAEEAVDYIGFGPLFSTPTKPEYRPIGLEEIKRVHQAVRLPIFCIGGIKQENLPEVIAAGARRVVIVSGLLQADDPADYARRARSLLPGPSSQTP